ncbi:glycosyltransferase [Sphingomonas sp. DT-207]|uniref:glycosyltransferase n=1 Tax=Sphingomonas sp. DT-207 TaxID=3396167 RepID=UPI003F19EBCD
MTKVLIDARIGWSSGIGRYTTNAVPRVARAMSNVHFDLLVTPGDAERARNLMDSTPNLHVREIDLQPFSMAEQWQIPRLARDYDWAWFVNYWVPLGLRTPFIAVVHDMLHLEPTLFPASRLKRALSRLTFRHLKRCATGISFDSRFTKREFERLVGKPRHAMVCGIGIDHDGWRPFDPAEPPTKEPRLLLVAAAKAHKNFRIAIDAFVRAELPESWRLTIVTPDAKLRSSIDVGALIDREARIEILSGLSNKALRDLYGRAAVVLMPSRYEGFGLPLLEGLQSGAQLISSTAASLVEVGQGAQLTYVDPSDLEGWTKAIETECRRFDEGVIDTRTRSDNMRHALSYDWDGVAQDTLQLIRTAAQLNKRNDYQS